MAVGVFIAFTPTIGLQMIAAVVAATLTYSSRTAAAVAVWITNPFTAIPIYMMTYQVGRVFTPNYPELNIKRRLLSVVKDEEGEWLHLGQQFMELMSLGKEVLIPLTIGGFIVGTVAGVITYVLTRVTIEVGKQYFPRLGGKSAKHDLHNDPNAPL